MDDFMPKAAHETIAEFLLKVLPKIALACELPPVHVIIGDALSLCQFAFVKMKALSNPYPFGLQRGYMERPEFPGEICYRVLLEHGGCQRLSKWLH